MAPFSFDDEPGIREYTEDDESPNYRYDDQDYGEPSRASAYMVNLIESTDDPRDDAMFRRAHLICPAPDQEQGYSRDECTLADTLAAPVYRGHPNGWPQEPDSAISRIGNMFAADSSDFVWFLTEEL